MALIVHVNGGGKSPVTSGSLVHTRVMKVEALRLALEAGGYDAGFGGARRDEERSRVEERIVSHRSATRAWNPRNQRSELWRLFNTRMRQGGSMRGFPLSDRTELDVREYVAAEAVTVAPLHRAAPRPAVTRPGALIVVDDDRLPLHAGEAPSTEVVRFRTLGCYPLNGAVRSRAGDAGAVIDDLRASRLSEREGRLIDDDEAGSMERKREGTF